MTLRILRVELAAANMEEVVLRERVGRFVYYRNGRVTGQQDLATGTDLVVVGCGKGDGCSPVNGRCLVMKVTAMEQLEEGVSRKRVNVAGRGRVEVIPMCGRAV